MAILGGFSTAFAGLCGEAAELAFHRLAVEVRQKGCRSGRRAALLRVRARYSATRARPSESDRQRDISVVASMRRSSTRVACPKALDKEEAEVARLTLVAAAVVGFTRSSNAALPLGRVIVKPPTRPLAAHRDRNTGAEALQLFAREFRLTKACVELRPQSVAF